MRSPAEPIRRHFMDLMSCSLLLVGVSATLTGRATATNGNANNDDPRRTILRGRVVSSPLDRTAAESESAKAIEDLPMGGLRVVLRAQPWPEAAPVDTITVETAEDGSFETRLLDGLIYDTFAHGSVGKDGFFRRTEVVQCQGGSRVELEEIQGGGVQVRLLVPEEVDVTRCTLSVPGQALQPLAGLVQEEQVTAASDSTDPDSADTAAKAAPGTRRVVLLPPFADTSADVKILNDKGHVVASYSPTTLRLALERRLERARKKLAEADQSRATAKSDSEKARLERELRTAQATVDAGLHLRHPRKALDGPRILMSIQAGGRGVEGVQVTAGSAHGALAVSDSDGFVEITVANTPANGGWSVAQFDLSAPNHRCAQADILYQVSAKAAAPQGMPSAVILDPDRDMVALRKSGKPDMVAKLEAGGRMRGRIVVDGKPLAGLPLRIAVNPAKAVEVSSFARGVSLHQAQPMTTDADGRFDFHGTEIGGPYLVQALLGPELQRGLGEPFVHHIAIVAADSKASEDTDLGTIDLRALTRSRTQCLRSDGQAARFAKMLLSHVDPSFATSAVCDRVGRICMLLPRKATYDVAIAEGVESKGERCELGGPTPYVLRLEAPLWVHGVVRNGKGHPLEGANVQAWPWGSQSVTLLQQLSATNRVTSGADGRYRLPLRKDQAHNFTLYASLQVGQRTYNLPNATQHRCEGADLEIDLELPDAPSPSKVDTEDDAKADAPKRSKDPR